MHLIYAFNDQKQNQDSIQKIKICIFAITNPACDCEMKKGIIKLYKSLVGTNRNHEQI